MKTDKIVNLPLDKFINISLYNKKSGYYIKKNPFGKKGDFITAPNVSRLFSEMIAIWVVSFWKSIGSPKEFNLIELGAGNAAMMKILIESFKKFPSFFKSCRLVIYEISPTLKKIQKKELLDSNFIQKDPSELIKLCDDPLLDSEIKSDFYRGTNYISSTTMSELSRNIISLNNLRNQVEYFFETLIIKLDLSLIHI